jgi:predicted ferric reductase
MIPGFLLIVIVLGIGISVEIIINRKLSNVFLAYVAGALVGFSIFIGSIYLYVQLKSKYPQVVSPIEKILKPWDNYNESVDEERR